VRAREAAFVLNFGLGLVACGAFSAAEPTPDAGAQEGDAAVSDAASDATTPADAAVEESCGWETFSDAFDDRPSGPASSGPWEDGRRHGEVTAILQPAAVPRQQSLLLQATTADAATARRFWSLVHSPLPRAGTTPSCLNLRFSIYVEEHPTTLGIIVASVEFAGGATLSVAFGLNGFEIAEANDSVYEPRALILPNHLDHAWSDVRLHFTVTNGAPLLHAYVDGEVETVSLSLIPPHFEIDQVEVGMMHARPTQSTSYYLDDVSIR
jgi:hypothetical protein